MTEKNLLAGETSPYLQQHRDNPVYWQPWGQAALDSARESDKPILLSVGYSACHWCHVMAHECFEDEEVASVMNALFVNIKVDREERPDIDQIYMAALNATGEQGGWPLTMFLTPDARPFWGGTYFPKEPRYGRPGFIQVMQSVHQAWNERRQDIDSGASQLTDHVSRRLSADRPPAELSAKPLEELASRVSGLIDPVKGGITGAPKFPNAPFMQTLWLAASETGNPSYADQVTDSFEKMLDGGIYDHVGGGLCRYSTDADWIVPHFEKMLYDNAQLIDLCTLAHFQTGKELFRDRINETIDWLTHEMTMETGAFASSLDADSEGEEGKFYLWTHAQIDKVLKDRSAKFLQTFKLESPHGWEGDPILIRRPDTTAERHRDELKALRQQRERRIRPGRDDKVLTDWNGLMINAIALAAWHFSDDGWRDIAAKAFKAIVDTQDDTGRLPHSVNRTSRLFPALSLDYAAMINAAVSLYQLSADSAYINTANRWAGLLSEDHGDRENGYFLSSSKATDVPIRIRGDVDEAIPSATSQIVEALTRLASVTGNIALQEQAHLCAAGALGRTAAQNYGQAGIFNSVYKTIRPAKLVIVENNNEPAFSAIAKRFPDPRRVNVVLKTGQDADADTVPGASEFDTSKPGAWLCSGQTCLPPIREPKELEKILSEQTMRA